MAVKITKGAIVNLKKEAPTLKRVLVGLGWDPVKGLEKDIDIDASIICIDERGCKNTTVYFGNLRVYHGAIRHNGDNLTGEGGKNEDDEQIEIDLERIPANIHKLAIIINIYEADERGQHFGKVENCFVRVADLDAQKELLRYDVEGNYKNLTGIFVADLYRDNGEWKFQAIGDGVRVRNIREMEKLKCR